MRIDIQWEVEMCYGPFVIREQDKDIKQCHTLEKIIVKHIKT